MRRFLHLTPRYVVNRLRWAVEHRLNPDHPWLTREAVHLLERTLRADHVGVEFGSGRSTVWFAERLGRLVSIEHDAEWYGKVRAHLTQRGLAHKVDYRLHADEDGYVASIENLEEASVDFCLVDGAARDRCAVAILPKLRPGALLVIDNVNWYLPNDDTHSPDSRRSHQGPVGGAWLDFVSATEGWRRIWTSNGVTDTALWYAP